MEGITIMNKLDQFFARFIKHTNRDLSIKYVDSYHFDLTESVASELLDMVISGQKKATAGSFEMFKLGIQTLPKVGDLNIITDFHGNPRCVVETKGVTILPFKDLTFEIIKREGEDDNLESWRESHIRYFTSEAKELGYQFNEDMLVVFEDFEVLYVE